MNCDNLNTLNTKEPIENLGKHSQILRLIPTNIPLKSFSIGILNAYRVLVKVSNSKSNVLETKPSQQVEHRRWPMYIYLKKSKAKLHDRLHSSQKQSKIKNAKHPTKRNQTEASNSCNKTFYGCQRHRGQRGEES